METLGTVLPTAASIEANRKYQATASRLRSDIIETEKDVIDRCVYRYVAGESRWYLTSSVFCIPGVVGRRGLKWFEVREDGWEYSVDPPKHL